MPESTIPNHAEKLIEAVSNRLRGIINVLDLMRQREDSDDGDTLMILEDAIGDQIDTLENHLLPIVQRGPALPLVRAVPRAGDAGRPC